MSDRSFSDTAKRGQSYIYLVDVMPNVASPRLLIGKIKVHGAKRDPTPKCASGFTCSDGFSNPFEYGHVMSWEMGGPNEVENIVPMYGRWQANITTKGSPNRSWRDMEVTIKQLASKPNQFLYIAIVDYKPSGVSYATQSANFKNWQQLFDWEEARIPTGFDVYVEPVGSVYGKLLVEQFLDPKGFGKDMAKERNALLSGAYPGTPVHHETWDHSKLPPQDRDFLLRNMTAVAIDNSYESHNLAKLTQEAANKNLLKGMKLEEDDDPMDAALIDQWAQMPLSPLREDNYNYITEHPDHVHDTLMKEFMVDAATAKSVTTDTMLRAHFHGNPLNRNVKVWTKQWEAKKAARKQALLAAQKDKRYQAFDKARNI